MNKLCDIIHVRLPYNSRTRKLTTNAMLKSAKILLTIEKKRKKNFPLSDIEIKFWRKTEYKIPLAILTLEILVRLTFETT